MVPEGIPPRAALARRTLWLVKRSSLVVLLPERAADRQWGPGSRHVFLSSLYHLKPLFVVASRPPAAPAYCRVVASDLFATVDGYWVVPIPSATGSATANTEGHWQLHSKHDDAGSIRFELTGAPAPMRSAAMVDLLSSLPDAPPD